MQTRPAESSKMRNKWLTQPIQTTALSSTAKPKAPLKARFWLGRSLWFLFFSTACCTLGYVFFNQLSVGYLTLLFAAALFAALQSVRIFFLEGLLIPCDHEKCPPAVGYTLGNKASRRCAILIHGFADTPEAWRRQAFWLAQHGWFVIVPLISHDVGADAWISEIVRILHQARKQHTVVTLWGHSLGGAIAAVAAEQAPPDALFLLAPFCAPFLGSHIVNLLFFFYRLLFWGDMMPTGFPANRRAKGSPCGHYRVRRVIPKKTFAAMLKLPKRLRHLNLSCPITLLLPYHDTVVDTSATLRLFPAATCRWATNPTASHALTNAADWQSDLSTLIQTLPNEIRTSL